MPIDPMEQPPDRPGSGGMRAGGSVLSQTGISGAGMSGYMDLRPDTGISGLAWLGIGVGIVILAVILWEFLRSLF